MNFEGTIEWLYGFQKFGIKLGLERISHICNKLGDPQKNYKIIHVGGTNGKGSVCRFLQSILTHSGYKVGIYTSPHLQRFSERFVVDGKEISQKDVALLAEKIKPIIDKMVKNDNSPTFFEIVTAMAFQYFSDKKVDYALIEVGLGGRYDATNIVDPVVTIITNVSLEHQTILGDKIEDIAFEKAGIIKDSIPVITGATGKTLEMIQRVAKEKISPVTIVEEKSWKKISGGVDWQEFLINGSLKDYNVKTSMTGRFQGENITIALKSIEILQMNGLYVTEESIFEGIEKTTNPGRMEIAGFEPIILLDGAHNPAGIQVLVETLKNDFDYDKLIVVLGILFDKDIKSMLSIIVHLGDVIVTTKSHNDRACDPSELKKMIEELCYRNKVVVKDQIPDAVEYAKSIAKKDDLICVTGSLFTVGEAKDYLVENLQKC